MSSHPWSEIVHKSLGRPMTAAEIEAGKEAAYANYRRERRSHLGRKWVSRLTLGLVRPPS